ncbi:MAG TPA: TauD/TfdA family dioxygenase [Herbaspirillum sp.]
MSFTIRPLSPSIGAEAVGFDPRNFTDEDRDALQQAWYKHLVMLIRPGVVLSDDEFVAFMSRMGQIENARKLSPLSTRQEVMIISNIRENGQTVGALPDGELSFHFDRVHQKKPTRASCLHAIEIPDHGGDTCFANMYEAYETLPDDIKQKIDGRMALNTYDYGATSPDKKVIDEVAQNATHPVVRTIPETGRKALFVSRLMTDQIIGLPSDESRDLLNRISDHAEQSKFIYQHQWKVGDILMWDNRCSTHARQDFDGSQRRLMKRIALADSVVPSL